MSTTKPCTPHSLQSGEIDALTCYVFRYLKPLTRYGMIVIKNEFAAEDLATANLEQLWLQRHKMADERTIHSFLRRNMYGLCCRWLHEQLIIHGFITMPPGWSPKYSKPYKFITATHTPKTSPLGGGKEGAFSPQGARPGGGLPTGGGQEGAIPPPRGEVRWGLSQTGEEGGGHE